MTYYRPISLLIFFSKLFKTTTHSRLSHHLHINNILATKQHDFRQEIHATQTRNCGSHRAAMNTNCSGVPKLRDMFVAVSQQCCHCLQNEFNGQSYSLNCHIMKLHLQGWFCQLLKATFKTNIILRNQRPGNHTCHQMCVGLQKRNSVEAII
jgi:hypothetical protein